jgi:uncharacterized membrane protein
VHPLKRIVGGILSFCEHKRIHAFKIQLNSRIYYVCARCSGFYLGIFSGLPICLVLLFYSPLFHSLGPLWLTLIALGLALPAMIDWSTQRLALRESRNSLRFGTGFPAGFSLSWFLLAPIDFLYKIPTLFAVLIFLLVFSKIDRRTPPEASEEEKPDP